MRLASCSLSRARANRGAAWLVVAAAVAIGVPAARAAGAPVLKKGDRVAIVGDSITEQKLYSVAVEVYLLTAVPELDLKAMQFGWSGETAGGLLGRMANDLLPWRPDVVTLCYGMNDGGYRAYDERIGAAYGTNLARIVGALQQAGASVVVGSPGAVDSFHFRGGGPTAAVYNTALGRLTEIAKQVAESHQCGFADVHAPMMRVMEEAKAARGASYPVAGTDGVHPGANGHLVMAYAFLRGLGLDGRIGAIAVDWPGRASATEGHAIRSFAGGTVDVASVRYPFCSFGETNDPNGMASVLSFVPFQDELNRFVLTVTNLPAPQADVKWGSLTRTFSREQLAGGINLAAEFLDNPFCAPSRVVARLVASKQAYETDLVKKSLVGLRQFDRLKGDADVTNAVGVLRRKLLAEHEAMYVGLRAAVKPVRHSIEITPRP